MKSASFFMSVCGLFFFSLTPNVFGATNSEVASGQFCQWYTNADSNLTYSYYGALNNHTGAGTWATYCPAPSYSIVLGSPTTINQVNISIYDNSSTDSFSCTVAETNWDGSLHWSATESSCSTYGGCNYNSNPGFVGATTLQFNNPISATNQYPQSITFECQVPSQSTLYGYNMNVN